MSDQDPILARMANPAAALDAVRWYFVRILEVMSQFVNVVVFFSTNPMETLSSRCYRLRNQGNSVKPWRILQKILDFCAWPFHVEHCRKSYETSLSNAYSLVDSKESE